MRYRGVVPLSFLHKTAYTERNIDAHVVIHI